MAAGIEVVEDIRGTYEALLKSTLNVNTDPRTLQRHIDLYREMHEAEATLNKLLGGLTPIEIAELMAREDVRAQYLQHSQLIARNRATIIAEQPKGNR